MKRILTTLIVLISTLSAWSQHDTTSSYQIDSNATLGSVIAEYHAQRQFEIDQIRKELMNTRHQIRLGFGFGNYLPITESDYYYYSTYKETISRSPSMWLEYSYRAIDFFEVGVTAYTQFGSYNQYIDVYMPHSYYNQTLKEYNSFFDIAFGVFARYSWYNRKLFSIYTTLGLGNRIVTTTTTPSGTGQSSSRSYTITHIDFTPVGFKVGGKLFGFIEPLTFGYRGVWLNAGVGYKF